MSKEIELTQGKFAIVDDDDFDLLNQWSWNYSGKYASRSGKRNGAWQSKILMHRLIMNAPDGLQVDHIDGNKLNNQKMNLRLCTHAENRHNVGKFINNTTGYKGVYRNKNKYQARLKIGISNLYLGQFDDPKDAARAYDNAAREKFGQFANTNFED